MGHKIKDLPVIVSLGLLTSVKPRQPSRRAVCQDPSPCPFAAWREVQRELGLGGPCAVMKCLASGGQRTA